MIRGGNGDCSRARSGGGKGVSIGFHSPEESQQILGRSSPWLQYVQKMKKRAYISQGKPGREIFAVRGEDIRLLLKNSTERGSESLVAGSKRREERGIGCNKIGEILSGDLRSVNHRQLDSNTTEE